MKRLLILSVMSITLLFTIPQKVVAQKNDDFMVWEMKSCVERIKRLDSIVNADTALSLQAQMRMSLLIEKSLLYIDIAYTDYMLNKRHKCMASIEKAILTHNESWGIYVSYAEEMNH